MTFIAFLNRNSANPPSFRPVIEACKPFLRKPAGKADLLNLFPLKRL
jgi:hypothetical protein